jgi:hypothetical protein
VADFISFNEGRKELANNGLPSTCYFLLSTKPCSGAGTFAVTDTLAGGVGEISGTGYARQSQSEPTASSANPAVISFTQMTWSTGSATDWSNAVKSVVLVTSADNSGKAICAWNLITGGTARDLSQANTTELFTPTLNVA